ncbi:MULTISPECIES: metallophosphoesterase family protein [Enterobacteriaceae]|uniref:metallophosphoesterase family protein n=1 Tax=Enterobacteriaceae TaxID=543 RepID=UPI00122F5E7B|nr:MULTISPECIES: metallophosphoesterase [Enterobacteriaceae]HCH7361566.1 metallophosphoesterase [Escherichia coli]HDC4625805.1 metallophosphoesterase [Enterobacter kobei]KAA3565967.1 metallophosphoesterase-domain-containing protein [Enterobacter cloacae]KAA3570913.1 metallophosphoesterase-domain-containing protein [Enterobacter cloacae]KAA3582141.1 metallophosphoesterase-domain-containing protein [Enterobacter cloacae]
MKIALVADIHHGPHSHTKKEGWDALPELDAFIAKIEEAGVDMLVDLGDRISDTNRGTDLKVEAEVRDRLAQFKGPRYHVIGNHDVGNLTPADNREIFGANIGQQVVDLGFARLILWQADTKAEFSANYTGFRRIAGDLTWLIEALNADERPAIIATHVPLSGHSQIGNFYFENNYGVSTYPDHAEVRAAVEATGKAAIWLSGHVHWNTVTNVHNIQHITIQSFSERFTTYPEPATAYAILDIKESEFTLEVFGRDPFFIRLPFRASGTQKWLPAIGPFGGDAGGQVAMQEGLSAYLSEDA